jgi:hypothetical protein
VDFASSALRERATLLQPQELRVTSDESPDQRHSRSVPEHPAQPSP